MLVKRYETVRSSGRVYTRIALKLSGGKSSSSVMAAKGLLRARVVVGDIVIPARIRPLPNVLSDENECILDRPWVSVNGAIIEIWSAENDHDKASFRTRVFSDKWESRVNRRLRKKMSSLLVEGENDLVPGQFCVKPIRCCEGGEGRTVWRMCAEWLVDPDVASPCDDALPAVTCFDSGCNALGIAPVYLEKQRGVRVNDWTVVDRLFFSLDIPESCKSFIVVCSEQGNLARGGFCCMDPGFAGDMQNQYREETKDACGDDGLYRKWFRRHRATLIDLSLQERVKFTDGPMFSIVVPCFNSDSAFLDEAVVSVLSQSYQNWELILVDASPETGVVYDIARKKRDDRIKYCKNSLNGGIVANTNEGISQAEGSYLAFLDHDDVLEPDALFHYAKAITDHGALVLYCDEDSFHRDGDYGQPSFKSDFNRDLLYCHNYITHFFAIQRKLVERIGLSRTEVSGAQDYDLVLRALAAGAKPYHVPRILYHWRIHEGSSNNGNVDSKPYAVEAGRVALRNHFESRGVVGTVEALDEPFTYRMHYALPSPVPLVSVVIPTQDKPQMVEECVESLFSSNYSNLEIVLVENGSVEQRTFDMYEELMDKYASRIKVAQWDKGFNYSKLINYGARFASGEYLLLLNNDTKVISNDFIEEMLGYLQRPEVGVVGAKLFFEDGLVQHAGIMVGPFDALVHVHEFFSESRPGYLARAVRPGNFSAVTGACQMVRKPVFDEVGGYDENFAVGFNDADFCLRVQQAGYCVTYTPYAHLYHYEFTSRGREEVDDEKLLRWKREQSLFINRWPDYFVFGDPFSNPNLRRDSMYFDLGD